VSIIEIKDVSYTYPGAKEVILKKVNLSIEKGEFITLTGPSSCGKTTLCRCINGLIPHFYGGEVEGEIIVNDLSVKENPTNKLAENVGFVFQNPENQLFAMTVEKDIAFGLENLALPREDIRKRVDWAMDILGIEHLRDKAPHELSGGQKQRVALSSVLSMRPEIIILDEPTSFLDPVTANNLFKIVKKLNDELDLTIILVEHRLDMLSFYSKRFIIMDKGEVKLDGPPRDILGLEEAFLLGVGIPKVIRLYKELKEEGITLGKTPISSYELADEIRGIIKS
jgi:energy-coupling factor transporter ATP-binding protein EcfA2